MERDRTCPQKAERSLLHGCLDLATWRETESWEANTEKNSGEGKDAPWIEDTDRRQGGRRQNRVEGQRDGLMCHWARRWVLFSPILVSLARRISKPTGLQSHTRQTASIQIAVTFVPNPIRARGTTGFWYYAVYQGFKMRAKIKHYYW